MSMISARVERLPFARFHTHLLLMGGLGYAFDAMDAAVLAFILPVLRTTWNLSKKRGWLFERKAAVMVPLIITIAFADA